MLRTRLSFLAVVAIGLAVVACQTDDLTSTNPELAGVVQTVLPGGGTPDGNGVANLEEFELCKYGTTTTFDYSVVEYSDGTTTSGQVTLDDGDCIVIAQFGGAGANVTVTEIEPTGWDLDRVDVTVVNPGTSSTSTVAGPTVSEDIGGSNASTGLQGVLAEYYNIPEPPPPGGGEGCTPGFWKNWTGLGPQPNVWPAGTNPSTTLFSDIFDNAFPGLTLLDALKQGGGGLNALGRHAAAAYLNALSLNVDYDLTATEVVNMFNAAYPGSTGEYNALKGIFEGFNKQHTIGFCE